MARMFSGKDSKEWWAAINESKNQKILYQYGCMAQKMETELKKLQAENKRLRSFLGEWDGHGSNCGVNSEGFEGCDLTMFNCDCGYAEAKRQALQEKP